MMAQKHYLHELLQEDQEPFQLKKYIADRRCQLKTTQQLLQLKKRKPISQTSKFPSSFCKNACFLSFHDSPDPRKSPLFEFPSPAKSPCATPNRIFLHIPAKTAALLLEAASRIQKQSSKQKNKNKCNGVGLFGSIRRRLTHRKRESGGDEVKLSVKDILRWDSAAAEKNDHEMAGVVEKSASEISFSSFYNANGRPSSAVWSESNEDKSLDLDLETSCSSQSEEFDEDIQFASCESPFRFVLQKSPSSGRRTPDFTSPVTSPSRHKKEDKENHHQEIEVLRKFQLVTEEEEEEKEQCSPVSVLDTPFEDDDEGHVDEDEDEEGFDLECSYAIVQRAKQQLLHKLRRFERLAELDPIELEKRMLEQDHDDKENDIDDLEEEEECEDYESVSTDTENSFDGFVKEVLSKSSFHHVRRIPEDMKRLVTDLIAEEELQNWSVDREAIVKRFCRRLDSWKEVESNTIDMMVEQDIRKELDGWTRNREQVREAALEIELAIFGLLMEELSEELVVSTGN